MECDPAESEVVEKEAAPELSVAEPIWFLPSLNVTLPVAVAGVTKAVKVTFTPAFAGLTSAVNVVEVVAGEPGPGGGGGAPGAGGDPAADADEAALPPPHPMEKRRETQMIEKMQRIRTGMKSLQSRIEVAACDSRIRMAANRAAVA